LFFGNEGERREFRMCGHGDENVCAAFHPIGTDIAFLPPVQTRRESSMKDQALLTAAATLAVFSAASMAQEPAAQAAQPPAAQEASEPMYATVNGRRITMREFQAAYANHVRSQFYHREGIADERLLAARREVGERLIDQLLLVAETERRKVPADEEKIRLAVAGYESRYASSPMWQSNREKLLPGLMEKLAEQSRLERLQQTVQTLPQPPEAEVKAFYESNSKLFTEPDKLRVRTILRKVAPSAPAADWDTARREVTEIAGKLNGGADFADLAREKSQDPSAASGGDMGYLHLGMLPEPLQARIDKIGLNRVSDPIDVLEGVAVFRVDERVVARQRNFAEVAERARDLLLREQQARAWTDFLADLRRKAEIKLAESQERK
jgi:parvulin-like peptidyl-prolyl isomerase